MTYWPDRVREPLTTLPYVSLSNFAGFTCLRCNSEEQSGLNCITFSTFALLT
jgi:hypothetical protein